MLIQIVTFVSLLSYAVIASQPFMYILAFTNTQMALRAPAYIEFRQLVDANMRSLFRYIIYITLLASVALVIVHIRNPGSLEFITAAFSLVALIAEVLLTVKGSLPINDIVNNWSPDNYPDNWQNLRTKWFQVFRYRQVASVGGFISLVAGVIF